ncbi:MAG: hypothetical protein L0206_16095 [Actinobacteria bacterium]|nr:hypothetical protein [Actinomycetota bacterium]
MNSEEAYQAWAPEQSPWSPWVKPILFANQPVWDDLGAAEPDGIPAPPWVSAIDPSTAFVVDLPGAEGVAWGVALARRGWRPVPLYNALPGESFAEPGVDGSALVDVSSIVRAMRRATAILGQLALAEDRPPAFLLDAQRRYGTGAAVRPGQFDNRSVSLPTDFPSGLFLRSRGIERVVLVQQAKTEPQVDLAHTLLAWQEAGLSILSKTTSTDGPPEPIRVKRPSNFRVMWYRCLATLGLRRSPLGGFGGMIPVPSAG